MNITETIKPIKLLSGSHQDTGETGQGCFMNVIAYLNGEPQITDKSPCVCFVVKPIAIMLNDFLFDSERHELIPFIERAMGSVTDDKAEIMRRINLAVDLADKCKTIAAESAAKSADYAVKSADYAGYAAKYADYAAKYAKSAAESAESADYAVKSAEYAANYAKSAAESAAKSADYAELASRRNQIKTALFKFMDSALPKSNKVDEIVISRVKQFVALSL